MLFLAVFFSAFLELIGGEAFSTYENKLLDLEYNCISVWDGSHKRLVEKVKRGMANPDSFEHIETTLLPPSGDSNSDNNNFVIVQMIFREKDVFGNTVLKTVEAFAFLDSSCNVSFEETEEIQSINFYE